MRFLFIYRRKKLSKGKKMVNFDAKTINNGTDNES